MSGKNGVTGVGLVEAYDLGGTDGSQLANISTRGFVGTDTNVLIGGFILGPDGAPDAPVLMRAIGPSLASPERFGLSVSIRFSNCTMPMAT